MNRRVRVPAILLSLTIATAAAACAPQPRPTTGPAPSTPTPPVTAPPVTAPAGTVHAITFPVSPTASYIDSFGAPRSGGRSHQGQDLMAPKGSPAVAATSGVVTRIKHDQRGLSGNYLVLTGDDGWVYHYMHLNNDSHGADDGANVYEQAFAPGIAVGSRVNAGAHLGYVGDSGNAENAGSHLHFEMRNPKDALVNAYPSLRAATPAPSLTSPIGTWRSS